MPSMGVKLKKPLGENLKAFSILQVIYEYEIIMD